MSEFWGNIKEGLLAFAAVLTLVPAGLLIGEAAWSQKWWYLVAALAILIFATVPLVAAYDVYRFRRFR